MISARPEVRGRGVGRAVTAAATVVAPDRPAMLISSDDGRPVYERLGYVAYGQTPDEWDELGPTGEIVRYHTTCTLMRKLLT